MSSNFSFCPMGITRQITVGATPATSTFWLVGGVSGATTLAVSAGYYPPSGFRIANVGTVAAFIQLSAPASTATISLTNGIPLFQNTVESFAIKGQNAVSYISSGTCTIYVTPGEGI